MRIWKLIRFLPKDILRKLLLLPSVEQWNVLSKLLRQQNLGDKLYKLENVLDSSSYGDLYENVISLWQTAEDIVLHSRDSRLRGNDTNDVISLSPSLPCRRQSNSVNSIEQMMLADQKHYLMDDILTKVDRATMAVSLESRAPFLDHRLVALSHRIPLSLHLKNNQSKYLLRQILYDYVPKKLIERPKMGFAVPIEHWLRGDLRDWAESLLQQDSLSDYFHPEPILKKWREHLSGKRNWQYQLWVVLMFQAWRRSQ